MCYKIKHYLEKHLTLHPNLSPYPAKCEKVYLGTTFTPPFPLYHKNAVIHDALLLDVKSKP